MDIERIRRRLAELDPLWVDLALAIGLALVACLQVWMFAHLRPAGPPHPFRMRERLPSDQWIAYVAAAGSFLPLALRRRVPWLALLLSGSAAFLYTLFPWPPAFTILGPMIALYSLAAAATRRRAALVALLAGGLILSVPALALTRVRWVAEAVGMFALLAMAAFLGDAARSRREHIAQVEGRAIEAERTREEEALRRVDEERIRIARDVHDIVAHSLSIVAVQAAAADALLESEPERARESIGHIRVTSKQALAELRSMLDVLRTGDHDAPLEPAPDLSRLDAIADRVREAGVGVALDLAPGLERVPALVSVSVYRIVQEALTNVVRHARASEASVRVALAGDDLTLEVLDDGVGADAADAGDGHGIRGMAERVEALGGSFFAGPRTDARGFRVAAALPLARAAR